MPLHIFEEVVILFSGFKIFLYTIDVFTDNYDQCNASLLNKTKFRSIIVKLLNNTVYPDALQ